MTDLDCSVCGGHGYGDIMAYSICKHCDGSGLASVTDSYLNTDSIKANVMKVLEPNRFCITKWGATLRVNLIKSTTVLVSDPNSVDAGQWISINDIILMAKIKTH